MSIDTISIPLWVLQPIVSEIQNNSNNRAKRLEGISNVKKKPWVIETQTINKTKRLSSKAEKLETSTYKAKNQKLATTITNIKTPHITLNNPQPTLPRPLHIPKLHVPSSRWTRGPPPPSHRETTSYLAHIKMAKKRGRTPGIRTLKYPPKRTSHPRVCTHWHWKTHTGELDDMNRTIRNKFPKFPILPRGLAPIPKLNFEELLRN